MRNIAYRHASTHTHRMNVALVFENKKENKELGIRDSRREKKRKKKKNAK